MSAEIRICPAKSITIFSMTFDPKLLLFKTNFFLVYSSTVTRFILLMQLKCLAATTQAPFPDLKCSTVFTEHSEQNGMTFIGLSQ